jgi:hypothetical protein
MLARRTSFNVLLGSARVIRVLYAGMTYIVDCVIGVSSGHTGMVPWHAIYIVDCY